MSQPTTARMRRAAVVAASVAMLSVLGAGTALAAVWPGDNNNNGQIDRGDTGAAVVCAQQAVIYNGGSVGSSGADGQFGRNTEAGVRAYQNSKRGALDVDGQVGPNTGGAMTSDIIAIRISAVQHGDRDTANLMTDWLNRCRIPTYHDKQGHQIFH